MFALDTYNVGGNAQITECQLEIANGVYYPQERMHPFTEITKTFWNLMQYIDIAGYDLINSNPLVN